MLGYSLIKTTELAQLEATAKELNQELTTIKAKEDSEIPLKFIYEDKAGNKFYEYENFVTLPALRSVAVEASIKQLGLCLTLDEEKRLFDEMDKAINEERFTDVVYLIKDVQYRLQYLATESTLLDLATVYFVMDGENPKAYQENWKQKKLRAWRNDPDAKDFFLSAAWQNIKSYSDISVQDIASYLTKNDKELNKIWESIRLMKSSDTSTESTNSTTPSAMVESAT